MGQASSLAAVARDLNQKLVKLGVLRFFAFWFGFANRRDVSKKWRTSGDGSGGVPSCFCVDVFVKKVCIV